MNTTVKKFRSIQTGIAQNSGQAGALQTVFRACLVTGSGASNVQSATVASEVVTFSYAAPHNYLVGSVLLNAGASVSALNGEHRVASVPTTHTLTLPAPGLSDGSVGGTITSKLASAGWAEAYVSGNVSVFAPTSVESHGMHLRVDDSGTKTARVRAYESMSGLSTGVGPIPTEAQMAGGFYWGKSQYESSASRAWDVVADDRALYYAISPTTSDGMCSVMFAGDFASDKPGDAWGFCLTGDRSDMTISTVKSDGCVGLGFRTFNTGVYVARSVSGLSGAIATLRIGEGQNGSDATYSGGTGYSNAGAGPNLANAGILLTPVELVNSEGVRGRLPGLYHARQSLSGRYARGAILDGQGALVGRQLMAVTLGAPGSSTQGGVLFLDTTGPWER